MKVRRRELALESLEPRLALTGISVASVIVGEDAGVIHVLVRLDEPHSAPVNFTVSTLSGLAQAGEDYVHATRFGTFPTGQSSAMVEFEILEDDVVEPTESFFLDAFAIAGVDALSGRSEISITDATALPCDFVGTPDGCDLADMDALYTGSGAAPGPLTGALIAEWLDAASSVFNRAKASRGHTYVSGDANLDGRVNAVDLGRVLNHFGDTSGLMWGQGNFNTDANVDSVDLGLLLENFGFQPATTDAANAVNAFGGDLYELLQQEEGNVVFSPLSIASALTMTYAGAAGQTAAEMRDVLQIGPNADIHSSYGALLTASQELSGYNPSSEFVIANAIWPDVELPLGEDFVNTVETDYEGTAQNLDYSNDHELAEEIIDDWVNEKTRGKIDNLVDGLLSPSTVMVLTNTIYFKSSWEFPFDPNLTGASTFTRGDGTTVQAPTMHNGSSSSLDLTVPYTEMDGFQIVELPFRDGDLSMVIALPDIDSSNVLTPDTFADINAWLDGEQTTDCFLVSLPKFETSVTVELNDALVELGMPTAFQLGAADFSPMFDGVRGPAIDDVRHKTTIGVNEQGTEAAAATAVELYVCFAAGTPVLTPDGERPIEEIKVGDYVLARDEHNVQGELKPKLVEELFHGEKEVLEVRVGGQLIRPTSAHPFFVEGKGWVPAGELNVGDLLSTRTSEWQEVECVKATGQVARVHNFRVADFHTYFIGSEEWGFAIWTHNVYNDFDVNRSFHFMIRDNATSATLFMGRIDDPLELTNELGSPDEPLAVSAPTAGEATEGGPVAPIAANDDLPEFDVARNPVAVPDGKGFHGPLRYDVLSIDPIDREPADRNLLEVAPTYGAENARTVDDFSVRDLVFRAFDEPNEKDDDRFGYVES